MINNRIRYLAPIVKLLLEENPEARNSDNDLYIKYLNWLGIDENYCTVATLFRNIKTKGIASFESVGRCRRKCQELYPELRANKATEIARINEEQVYEDFAQDKRI